MLKYTTKTLEYVANSSAHSIKSHLKIVKFMQTTSTCTLTAWSCQLLNLRREKDSLWCLMQHKLVRFNSQSVFWHASSHTSTSRHISIYMCQLIHSEMQASHGTSEIFSTSQVYAPPPPQWVLWTRGSKTAVSICLIFCFKLLQHLQRLSRFSVSLWAFWFHLHPICGHGNHLISVDCPLSAHLCSVHRSAQVWI